MTQRMHGLISYCEPGLTLSEIEGKDLTARVKLYGGVAN